ncbi:MAG TPA: LPS export ABC transporter periplasmic protein LptC [Steroidobacteraceae bacterium]|jgi:lipopolysaccharide export system protein LptC|nr:LPS export ABC transporter periplasmic protein LptC [Steroidobacteraceae bacterium]
MFFRIFTLAAVAALLISTWILSSPARRPSAQKGTQQSDLPGYYLKNAILTDYDASGSPSIRIEAERIDQIDHGNEVALYNVRVNYDAPNGQNWTMVGDTAHVQPGGKLIDIAGNVRLQGENPGTAGTAVIRTDLMSYDVPQSTASTKSEVRIEYGGHMLTARGLSANLKERTIRLESKVNGRFLP